MATNVYFNNFAYAREQDLVEDLTIESIKIYGHNVKYMPKSIQEIDHLFGEDKLLKYETAADVEMYVKNVEGFEGEGDFMSKFGLQINDQLTLTVARKRFDQIKTEKLTTEVGYNYLQESANTDAPSRQFLSNTAASNTESIILETGTTGVNNYQISSERPQEGDLIFFPLVNKLFEIKFVEHEQIFYQTGRLQTYDLRCELFKYSSERFSTGNTEIDSIETKQSLSVLAYEMLMEQFVDDRAAQGTLVLSGGSVSSVTITYGSFNYQSAPTVTFSTPPQGVVSGVTVTVAGVGHINGQNYNTTGGSGTGLIIRGTGSGGMVGATVVDGGSGYQAGDVVQTSTAYPASIRIDSITNHTQATGTATINSNGTVTSVTLTEAGSGYTGDSHTVTFSQGEYDTGSMYVLEDEGKLLFEHEIETTDAGANNSFFEFEGESVIDFSESNPFSEVDRY